MEQYFIFTLNLNVYKQMIIYQLLYKDKTQGSDKNNYVTVKILTSNISLINLSFKLLLNFTGLLKAY